MPEHGGSDELLARNEAFAARFDRADLPALGSTGTVIVTCMDARADPSHYLGLDLGEALVLRGAGGRVTDRMLEQLAIIRALGGDEEPRAVLVVHHTNCGTARLTEPAIQDRLARAGVDPERVARMAVVDPAATAATDVARIQAAGVFPDDWPVTGYVYDVATGRVTPI